MKSKRLLILLLMALLVPWAANAQTLTVADGGNTNSNIPFKSYYQDYAQRCDYVIPADSLTAMVGKSITSVTLYPSYSLTVNGASVYFKVVTDSQITSTSFSGSDGTLVYTGSLSLATSGMVIPVNDYLYNGGNLLIGIYKNSGGSYPTGTFSGKNTSSSIYPSLYAYSSSATSWTSITTGSKYNFMPKTTFTYQTPPTCPKPTFTANNVTTNALTANLTWTAGGTETQWAVAHALTANAEPDDNIIDNAVNTLPTETAPYAVPNLALGDHYFWVRANCDATDQSDWVGPVQVHIGYCTPNPSSRDNKGITAVSFGTGNYIMDTSNANGLPASSPYYADYTFKVGGVPAGMTALVNISYTTGYNYGTLIWVDWNNNLAFEDSEIVFAGQSSDIAQPSGTHELEASFSIPSTQAQGDYRMRIAGADSYFDPYISNPSGTGAHSACFSSTYAVCHDYTLRVLEQPSCMPVSALTVDEANVTDTQIPISWTPGGTEDSWNIRWRKYGTTDTYSTATVTTNSYTISGLTADTKYEFGVQAGCDTQNIWIEDSYTTACGVVTIPADGWPQNFDSYTGVTSGSTNNLPHCWYYINTTSYSYYQGYPIIYGSSYSSGHSGKNYLKFYSYYDSYNSSYDPQPQYAILPEMGNLDGKQITLWAKGDNTSSTFKIGRMTNPADATTFVPIEISNGVYEQALTTSYQEFTYELTGNGNFLAIMIDAANSSRTTNGVNIDDILIEPIPTCKRPSALMLETPSAKTAHSASLKWTNGSDDQTAWQIAYSTASNFNPDTVTIVNVNTNPDTLTGLTQYTTYYAYVRANCGDGDFSKWSTSKYSFTTVSGHQTPTNLAYDPATLTSSSVRVNWKGVAANELHMYYELYYDTLSTRPNPLVAENLKIVQGEIDTTYLLEGLQAEKKYYVWVRDTCGTDGYSAWTSTNFTTASACQTPDGLKANDVTINSASITWNTYGLSDFNLRYNNDRGDTITLTNVNSPCPLEDLTSNTPYQVQVQAACNPEAWSPVLNFSTDCDAISVASEAYFYDFETTQKWNCWTNIQGASISNTNSGNSGPYKGSYYLKFSGTNKNIAALPVFVEATNTLQIKFWTRPESYSSSSCGTFDVGYMTDLNDTSTFVKIERYNYNDWNVKEYRQKTVFFDGVPSDAVIAFRHNANSTSWYWFVDDVEVSVAPLCKPVKTFATSNVKAHSVDLAWTVYDETQTSFDVQYGFSQNFHEDSTFINHGVSLTEGKYVLSGLTHDTTYYVRVRANCGGGEVSPWSDSKRVVTLVGNQAPSSFAVVYGSEGPHYVSLVWDQGGELATSWDLYYVKSENAPEEAPTAATTATVTVNTLPTAEAPYLLEGLDAESRYYIWVRANCGIDGMSDWKALTGAYFTTLEACPTPVNGEVTNMTPVSAQLNWTGGLSENYNVQYRTAAYSYPAEGSFFEDFESGTLTGWTAIRGGEGVSQTDWQVVNSETLFENPIPAHSGTNVAMSRSWYSNDYAAPNVDNWLISPQVTLNGNLTYWVMDDGRYHEHYDVYVSTTTNDTASFTLLYEPGNASATWTKHTVDLSSYNGTQGYIAFRHTDNDQDWLFIDDVLVGSMVTVEAGAWSASIPAFGDSLVIERLSPETAYEWKVQAVCGGEDGNSLWSDSTSFTTPSACDAPVNLAATNETYNSATLSWSNYQETYNLRYRTAADADIYLEDSFEDGELGDWTVSSLSSSYSGVQEGYFQFGYTHYPPQYLISPLLDENGVVEGSTLYFLYQGYDDEEPETFQVGYSSTTNDVSAFTWGTTITIGADGGVYSQTIPAGTKYFAIQHTSNWAWYLYVANFLVFGPVTPAGEWVDVEGPVENPYTLTGLNPDTPYEFQVQGNNTSCEGDTTAWSQIGWFETLPLPTQTIALTAGWNWISSNVVITMNDLKAALVEAVPGTAITIKSKNDGFTNYTGTKWKGTLSTIDLTQMYQVQVTSACEITLTGEPINPTDYPINIAPGANWIAFPFAESMTLTDAFAGFAMSGDNIKSKNDGFANYTNRWKGVLTNLVPGQGYIFTSPSSETRTFIYPVNRKTSAPETGKKGVVRTSFDLKNFVFSKDATKISKTNLNKNKNNKQH